MLVTKLAPLKVKAVDEASGTISGYASTFDGIDAYGDTIAPGAFAKTLVDHKADAQPIPMLFEHNRALDSHVGEITEAVEDDTGLLITAQLDTDTEAGARALNLCKARRVTGLSIGFVPEDYELTEVDGVPGVLIKAVDLHEVSLVISPADSRARVTSVKSAVDPEALARRERADAATAQLTEVLQSIQKSEGPGALADAVAGACTKAADIAVDDVYLESLTTGKDTADPRSRGFKLTDQARAATEKAAATQIVAKARDEHRALTDAERDLLARPQQLAEQRRKATEDAATMDRMRALNLDGSGLDSDGVAVTDNSHFNGHKGGQKDAAMHKNTLPIHAKARAEVASRAVGLISEKAVETGSGSLTVSTETGGITALARPAVSILNLVPTILQATPAFSYLKQTARDLKAGRVPTSGEKPKSQLGFERVDANLEVVAHVVREVDEYILKDVTGLEQFIAQEMIAGVVEGVEAWLIAEVAAAEGRHLQAYDSDLFTTTRFGLNTLQTSGLTPSAIILSPDDWARAETAKATGSGSFVFHSAPVDQTNGTLWGVPVATSHRLATGTGYVLSDGAAELYHDGTARLAFNASQEEFEHNQLSFRAEGRFRPVVKREAGIVELTLTEDQDTDGEE